MRRGQPGRQRRGFRDRLAPGLGQLQGGAHGLDQRGGIHRLGQKIRRAGLDGAHAHGDVAVAGEKDDGDEDALVREMPLQLQAVQFRHGHVQHEARDVLRAAGFEEGAHGGETAHLKPLGPQQTGERLDHLRLVVENVNDAGWRGASGGWRHGQVSIRVGDQ